jgi:hypothetical protein
MMALVEGDFEIGERLGRQAMEMAEVHTDVALRFYCALMLWTWWQRGDLTILREAAAQAPLDRPVARAAIALVHAEAGEMDEAMTDLSALAEFGWDTVTDDLEGASVAMAAAACGAIGTRARDHARDIYEHMRPYAGTAVVFRAPAAGCLGPADQFLGLLASSMGNHALAEVHFEAALRLARRMRSAPFVAAGEVELARALRRRGREGEEEQVAVLLRSGEEAAVRMGLHHLAQRAAHPGWAS